MMNRGAWLMLVALFGLAPGVGCADSDAPGAATAGGVAIDGAEAKRLVAAGALLLDVRTPEEFADGHIDGARNLPIDRLDGELGTLPRDKTIVVYCASGARSNAAAQTLHGAGFDVRDLGRMAAWNW